MATAMIGKIGNIEGSVEVVHADGTKGSLEQGATVYADDAITTGENSNARIEFLDGSAMNIGPEFTAILDKDVFDPAHLQEDVTAAEAIVLDSSDREVVPDSGFDTTGKEKIGSVEKAEGVVEAVGEDGIPRVLEAGDALYANDVIRVDDDGSVSIKMIDGSDLSFGPGTLARMGDSVTTVATSEPSAVTGIAQPAVVDAAQIATIIQEGRDPTEEATAPAPAAGETGGNEGVDFTVIEPSRRAVTPDSGHDTHGFQLPFGIPEPELLEPEEEPGDAGVVTANASGPDSTVYEAGLPGGSTAGDGRDTVTGSFTIKATDCIKELIIDSEGVGAGGAPVSFSLTQIQAFNGTQMIDMGEGILTLTGYSGTKFSGKVDYSYTLKDNIDNDSLVPVGTDDVTPLHFDDTALITVKGDGGSTGSDELVIRAIDDVPTAMDDSNSIAEDTVPPITGSVLPNDTTGADVPASFVSWVSTTATYGTFTDTGGGTYEYLLDNTDPLVQGLDTGDSLTETFNYTMVDADGDTSPATLTITINGADDITTVKTAAVTGPDNTIYEAGLVPDGSTAGDGRDTDTGTFTINATDGIMELVIDPEGAGAGGAPVTFTLAEVKDFAVTNGVVDMGEGILTLTGYTGDPALGGADFAGEVAYSYTLKDNIDNDSIAPVGTDDVTPLHFDDTALLTVNGIGGSTGSDELLIRAIDDVPTAMDDSNSIAEDTVPPITGSVLPNDTTGADVPASFVSWVSTTATYGTFTDTGGGTYEYLLDNTDPLVQGLDTGDSLTETFNYTMVDADGDTSPATLTITINGADDITTVKTAAVTGPDNTIYEAGLVPDGSTAGDGRDTDTGTFTINATDGIMELVIDPEGAGAGGAPVTFTLAEVKDFAVTNGVVDMGEGILTLTGYTGDPALGGADFAGEVAYSYTLKDNIDNDSIAPVGTDDVTPLHFDDTALLTVNGIGGSTGSDELLIRAIDDVPTAVDDSNSIAEDTVPPITGSVLPNDTTGADVPASFVSWVSTTATYGTFTDTGGGTYEYLLDNTDPLVQGLDTGDSLTETFNYTMVDADGDTSPATLTITINGADDITTVKTAAVTGPDNTVYEAGLVPDGSTAGDGRDTDTGTFTINATDGIMELVIDPEGAGAGGAPVTFTLAEVKDFAVTNGVVDMGEGILTLTGYTGDPALGGADFAGEVAYSYTLKDNIDNDSIAPVGTDDVTPLHFDDTALLTVNGIGGSTGSDELLIRAIDDVPTAVDDSNSIAEDTVPPITGSVLPNDTTGADVPASFVSWVSTTATYGTFTDTGGGTYEYLLDNTDPLVQGLDTGDSLTETFNYTMVDADGDTSPATLTITINGADDITTVKTAAVTGPDNTIYEAGLVPDGSTAGDGRDTDTGTFTINATDGIMELVIDPEGAGAGGAPVTFTLAEVKDFAVTNGVVDMGEGILTLTGYTGDPALGGADFAGEVAYSYTLKDNIDNDSIAPVGTDDVTPLHFDDTALLTVNGIGGSTGSDELLIRAIDDVPTAMDDSNSIAEDTVPPITGSVLPNDTTGADVPASFVSWVSTTATYGTFTDTGGGTYEYLLDNTDPLVQGLDTGDSLTETFNYTMVDADGDTSPATLTITINGADDITTVKTAAVTGPDNTVYEAGLVPDGSTAGDGRDTDTGTFTINATDGIMELVIDPEGAGAGGAPVTFTLAEVKDFAVTNGVVDMGEGILTLTGYTGDPALGGADFAGEVAYSYTLKDNIDNDSIAPVGTDDVTPLHFDDTALLTVNGIGGSTGSDELLIRAIDDVPTAVDDSNSIAEDTVPPITGSVLPNDTTGADVPASFVSWVSTTATYGTFTDTGGGTYEYLLDNTDPLVQGLDTGDSLTETFNYTMVDADGDTSPATLTITINGADDITTVKTAAVTGPDNTVYEAGLVPDGSTAGDGRDTDTGTFTINATDGIMELVIDPEGAGAGGAPVTFTLAEVKDFAVTNGVVDMGEGILTLTGYTGDPALGGADFAGEVAYSYTLKDNIDNDSIAPVGTDDVTPLHFDDTALLTVNGIGGSTGSDELLIRAIDDVPTALNNIKDPTVDGVDSNIVIMFDRSGSMEADPGVNGFSERIDLARAAVASLLVAAAEAGDVNVLIVDFATGAESSGWLTGADVAQQANAYLAHLVASGSTNYEAATQLVQDSYLGTGFPGSADQNLVYFLSDGDPTIRSNNGTNDGGPNNGDSDGLTDAEVAAWELFLSNNTATSYAVGIGTGTDLAELNEIADPDPAIEVTNESKLIETLLRTFFVNASGNVLTDVPADVFGADEPGQIVSIKVDTGIGGGDGLTTFVYDPNANAGAGEITNEDGLPVILGSVLVVTTKLDGELTFYFEDIAATANQGDYSYAYEVTPTNSGVPEVFEYVIEDADGDQSSATLTIDIPLISDLTGLPLIAGDNANNTLSGTGDAEILAGDDGNDTLNALGGDDLLFGGDGDDILNGGAGNDILIGDGDSDTSNGDRDFGNDILVGGTGNDVLVGARGADTLTGGTGEDVFIWNSRDLGTGSNEDTVTDFNTGEGDVLDIADLLVGEESLNHSSDAALAAALDADYISISIATNATVTLYTDGSGAGADQVIQMTGFNTTGFADSAAVIENLLAGDNLVVD